MEPSTTDPPPRAGTRPRARALTLAVVALAGFGLAYLYLTLAGGVNQRGRLLGALGGLFVVLTVTGIGLLAPVLRQRTERDVRREFPGPRVGDGQLDVEGRWAENDEELRQFTFLVAHDLREPARTAATHARLAQREAGDDLSEQAQEDIETAIWAAKRMDELLGDLLAYVSIGEPAVEPVDLEEVVDDAVTRLAARIDQTGAAIETGELATVQADRAQLVRVLEELIANAIKFVPPDRPPWVEIRVQETPDGWRLEVDDNGIGLDPDHAERAFDVFERLHDQGVYPGTGVGLAICRRIVELHEGEIRAESEPGEGTTVAIELPHPEATDEGTDASPEPVAEDR